MPFDLKTLGAVVAVVMALLVYNHFIDNPHVRELQIVQDELACTERATAEAEAARKAEAARQREVNQGAIEGWRAAVAERDRLHQIAQDALEQEITRNEEALAAAGRSCPLDQSDIDWLRR